MVRSSVVAILSLIATFANAQDARFWFEVARNDGTPGGEVVIRWLFEAGVDRQGVPITISRTDMYFDPSEIQFESILGSDFTGPPIHIGQQLYQQFDGVFENTWGTYLRFSRFTFQDSLLVDTLGLSAASEPVVVLESQFRITNEGLHGSRPWLAYKLSATSFQFNDGVVCVLGGDECDLEIGVIVHLPVELLSFVAFSNGATAQLKWSTASESGNFGFDVEMLRPNHSSRWETVGFVPGAGTTQERKDYRFSIDDLEAGKHHFRLKQIDTDGSFEYTDPATVEIALEAAASVSVYPNPATRRAQIDVLVSREQDVEAVLFDEMGRKVSILRRLAFGGERSISWDIERGDLAAGQYFLQLRGEAFVVTRPVAFVD